MELALREGSGPTSLPLAMIFTGILGWRPSYLPLTAENGFLDNPSGANRYPAGEKGILRILIRSGPQ